MARRLLSPGHSGWPLLHTRGRSWHVAMAGKRLHASVATIWAVEQRGDTRYLLVMVGVFVSDALTPPVAPSSAPVSPPCCIACCTALGPYTLPSLSNGTHSTPGLGCSTLSFSLRRLMAVCHAARSFCTQKHECTHEHTHYSRACMHGGTCQDTHHQSMRACPYTRKNGLHRCPNLIPLQLGTKAYMCVHLCVCVCVCITATRTLSSCASCFATPQVLH